MGLVRMMGGDEEERMMDGAWLDCGEEIDGPTPGRLETMRPMRPTFHSVGLGFQATAQPALESRRARACLACP